MVPADETNIILVCLMLSVFFLTQEKEEKGKYLDWNIKQYGEK